MRSIDELATEICTLAGRINAANHQFLALIAEFDRRNGWFESGMQSCAHWLNWKCGIALGAAREKVRVARALENLAKVSAAMASGRLSYSKAREITRVGNAANEDYLLSIAEHGTAAHVERLVRAYRRCQEAEELSREQRQQQRRRVSFRYDDDGSLILTCHLPAEVGALVMKALDLAIEGLPVHDDVPAGTSRRVVPFSARRADALARVAESFLAHDVLESPARIGSRSWCTSPPRLFAGRRRLLRNRARPFHRCRDRAPLLLRRQRRYAHRRRRRRPLNVGRKTRTVSAPLRRLLTARDKGCRFPGCCNARYIDMHHIKHWANGGETKLSNLISLCRFHHRAVHEGGFNVEMLDDGVLRVVRPDGRPLDSVLPGCSQPRGDWRKLPAAIGHWRYRGDRMDLPLAVEGDGQQSRKAKDVPAGTSGVVR